MIKKYFFIIITFISSLSTIAQTEWWSKTVKEDSQNFYYVGISEGQYNLQKAMKEAYNEALKEAVKHNFGFNQRYVESFYSTLERSELNEEVWIKHDEIHIKGIVPTRQYVTKNNNKYLVYREIKYSKYQIQKERSRLAKIKKNQSVTQKYKLEGEILGQLTVRTKPNEASLIITDKKGKHQINGTSDAIFLLPIGEYHIMASSPGHTPKEKNIVVSGKKRNIFFKLDPTFGTANLKITPKDALITIDGMPVKNDRLRLQTQKDYQLRISHKDYYQQEETISLNANEKITINKKLNPRPSYLNIISTPQGAKVYVNDKYAGKTPLLNYQTKPGLNKVTLKKYKYEESTKDIQVDANSRSKPLNFNLKYENKKNKAINLLKGDYTLSYNPLTYRDSDLKINLLPFGIDYFLYNNISLGLELQYYINIGENKNKNQYGREETQDYQSTDFLLSAKARYFFDINQIKVGVGPDLNQRKYKKENQGSAYTSNDEVLYEANTTSIGLGAELRIPFTKKKENNFGYKIDTRFTDLGDSESFRSSLGIYWSY